MCTSTYVLNYRIVYNLLTYLLTYLVKIVKLMANDELNENECGYKQKQTKLLVGQDPKI